MFVVLRHDFEYNDEIYYQGEHAGGQPIKVFHDESLAKLYAKELTGDALRGLEIGQYCYGLDEIDRTGKVKEILTNLEVNTEDWQAYIPKDISNEDLDAICDNLGIEFFSVVKVDDILPASLIKKEVESRDISEV